MQVIRQKSYLFKIAFMLLNLTDLIFENRNKLYGAYRLRKNYYYALAIALCCNIPLVAACIAWIKYEQKQNLQETQEQYVEREVMLQVDEEVEILDISDLPVMTATEQFFSAPEPNKGSDEHTTTENPNTEIQVSEQPENQEKPQEKQEEEKPLKDTTQNTASPNTEKAAVVYSPDVWSIYVKQNLQYPPQALQEKKECNVFVAVIIREDGSLELDKQRALYGCEEYFNEEVKRLIANAPRFIPATDADGKPKKKLNLKISFKLPPN